ncbi:type II toxin-antitoxin system RelE/ParE family toxin [Flavobacterium sp. CLA17]|uniref:type II toxin-antitoxin system RelE/ParE family toxin n=1 Tax=Flavobacterium sp. CLA17 TaxID=2724135 RepID=UPI00149236C8|nr:type II toxin-antitoxin system RelE/ParE family toxin [Flavobacterium sp. CLA17]QSB27217.1 type II toxin-antitoxin system RelE/ParE family toxin [Flavobacterium sp. CLA17]
MGREKAENTKQYTLDISEHYFLNLEEIVNYIAFEKHQPLNAIKVGNGINKAMAKIIHNPLLYSECENIPTKTKIYREASYKTWLIIFKIKKNHITILGVLSGKRKASSFRKIR